MKRGLFLIGGVVAVVAMVAWRMFSFSSGGGDPGARSAGRPASPASVPTSTGEPGAASLPASVSGGAFPPIDGFGAPTASTLPGHPPFPPEVEAVSRRIQAAFSNPDRRDVVRIRSELMRTARDKPELLVTLAIDASAPRHRSWALRTLGEVRAPVAHEAALKGLTDPVDYVRQNAAWALGRVGKDGDLAPLQKLLDDPQETDSVKSSAREAMASITAH